MRHTRFDILFSAIICCLVLFLAACGPGGTGNGGTPTPQPGVVLGEIACPSGLGNPAHWQPFLPTAQNSMTADSVHCAHLRGDSSVQAVVTAVLIIGGGPIIRNVYVFDNIASAQPKIVFHVDRLFSGVVSISGYSTLLTGEVDYNAHNKNITGPDLYREFQWSSARGTFVQAVFPGFYPDMTRYQAELDQRNVTGGQDTWKNDPSEVAKRAVLQFLGWQQPVSTTILSGGGPKDVYATVKVSAPPVAANTINVTLSRLEGDLHPANMWVVIGVQDGSALTLTNIDARSQIANPVILEGKGSAFEAVIGEAIILDHLYNGVGHARIVTYSSNGMSVAPYKTAVSYSTTVKNGPQEGLVEVQLSNGGLGGVQTAVIVKVLLS